MRNSLRLMGIGLGALATFSASLLVAETTKAEPKEQVLVIELGAVLDNHKWGYHGTYEKESFKQAQTSPSD